MRARGFTLIELIVVIVLLGIAAVSFTMIFTGTVSGYLDTAGRVDSATAARIALDRMGRELREAMPNSVRVNGDGSCVQFLPILSSSVYTDFPINTTTFAVLDFSTTAIPAGNYVPGGAVYAAIYPVSADQLYQLEAMRPLVSISAMASSLRTVTLASASTFTRQSPAERVYFVGAPVSYCVLTASGVLNRYVSAVTSAQPAPAALGAPQLLLDRLQAAAPSFRYQQGNWRANGLITIQLNIQRNASDGQPENLRLDHEVWVRNVE